MTRTTALLAASLLLAAAGCSAGREPTSCRADDQCAAASRCTGGVCAAAPAPVASLSAPALAEAYALVQLDGSASHDPGGGDLLDHRWTVRAVEAACAAPAVASGLPQARLRFACQGTYEVGLVVVNDLGLASAPAAARIVVGAPTRPSAVAAGADVVRDHRCEGVPLRCTVEPVALSAVAEEGVALRWTVEPPLDLPLGKRRVARFAPGPDVANPTVELETAGDAISGDWIFRVEAFDDYGVVAAAHTRLSVTNRPPVLVAEAPGVVPHRFDAARSAFVAAGEVAWRVEDPDGDPVVVAATWRHVGDGGASFDGALAASVATFAVQVPYAGPADALLLAGGEGLSRTLELRARDANRAEVQVALPVVVGNRPPVPARTPPALYVPHRFDAVGSRYVASADLGAWEDPDGDPLEVAAGTAPCADLRLVDGAVRAECAAPYAGVPAVGRLAGPRSVTVRVRDPWSEAAAVPTYTLFIENRAPALSRGLDVTAIPTTHFATWSSLCPWGLAIDAATYTLQPTATDPDGDPLLVRASVRGGSANPPEQVCSGAPCVPVHAFQPAERFQCWSFFTQAAYTAAAWLSASDGDAVVSMAASPPLSP